MQKRYIIINSTKYFEKYVVYDLILEDVIECHNLATAKSVAKELNEKNMLSGEVHQRGIKLVAEAYEGHPLKEKVIESLESFTSDED